MIGYIESYDNSSQCGQIRSGSSSIKFNLPLPKGVTIGSVVRVNEDDITKGKLGPEGKIVGVEGLTRHALKPEALEEAVFNYIEDVLLCGSEGAAEADDHDHYMAEAALETVLGKEVHDWLSNQPENRDDEADYEEDGDDFEEGDEDEQD